MKFYKIEPLKMLQSTDNGRRAYDSVGFLQVFYIPVDRVKAIEVFEGPYLLKGGVVVDRELFMVHTDFMDMNDEIVTDKIRLLDEEELPWLKRT